MTDRSILFSAPMVKAVLDGRKTQTRRVAKGEVLAPSPYGVRGDRLYGREAFSGPYILTGTPPRDWPSIAEIHYWADGNPTHGDWTKPKPGMHMPKWASRLWLEVVDVRVERLCDISEADAIAEGIICERVIIDCSYAAGRHIEHHADRWFPGGKYDGEGFEDAVDAYAWLWIDINGPGSWLANPLVWVVEFKVVPE